MVGRSTVRARRNWHYAGKGYIRHLRHIRKCDVLRVLEESDTAAGAIVIDANQIAPRNLPGRHQIREGMHQRLVNGAFSDGVLHT